MRVVYLADDFPPESFGGAGISTYELAKGVQDAGYEVFVITTCRDKREAGRSEYDGLPVFKIQSDYHERWRAWRSIYNPTAIGSLKKILAEIQPDVVHANNVHRHLSWASLKVAKRYARVVWTARDAMAVCYGKLVTDRYLEHGEVRLTWIDTVRQARLRYNPLRNFCIRKLLRYADRKIAVSGELRRALQKNGIENVAVLHTGITVWQEGGHDAAREFRRHWGLDNNKIILFGGRLSGAKGEKTAREAMEILQESMPEAVLIAMGGHEKREGQIVHTGWIAGKEKRAAFAASDVVWVPSCYLDPFPRMALEGMAAGKPVIATKFGGAPEVVADGVTGYVIDPRNSEKLAQKTIELLDNPLKAEAFGRAGKERIANVFNFDTYVRKYIEQYETYDAMLTTVPEFIKYAAPRFIRGTVLDIGGGKGGYRDIVGNAAGRYYVSDLYAPGADFHDDARQLGHKDGTFDTILCLEMLEHVDDTSRVVSELFRVLKPGGYALATTPFMYAEHGNPEDFYRFTPRGLEYVFNRAGFTIVEIGTLGGIKSTLAKIFKTYAKEGRKGKRPRYISFFIHRVLMKLQKMSIKRDKFFTSSYVIARKD